MKAKHIFRGTGSVLALAVLAGVWAAGKIGKAAETAPRQNSEASIVTPPASQPAESMVLVRLGDAETITQADFERAAFGAHLEYYGNIIVQMTNNRMFRLYLRDHPDLVPDKKLEATIDAQIKEAKLRDRDELKQRLKAKGFSYEQRREALRINLARGALIVKGQKLAADEAYLKARFQKNPKEFDGTLVSARHILLTVFPYETPTQREAKRERLRKIRKAVLSGERRWDEAVMQSDDPSRSFGGALGNFPRHLSVIEPVAKAAFALEPGEISDVVESEYGLHIVQTTARTDGTLRFGDPKVKSDMSIWLEKEMFLDAMREAAERYPVVGVQPPMRSDFLILHERKPSTQPAQSQPSSQPHAPAAAHVPQRPATKPAQTVKPSRNQTPKR